MGKKKKWKENHATKVTKNQKTKIWDERNLRNKSSPSEKISTHCVFIAARIDSKKRPENITLHLYYLLITTENCGRNF